MTTFTKSASNIMSSKFWKSFRNRLVRAPITTLVYILLSGWAAISLIGFSWVVVTSLKTNQEMFRTDAVWSLPETPQWENYERAWNKSKMGNYIFNSVWVSVGTVLFLNVVSAMAAYILARFRFKGSKFILGAFIMGSAIPIQLIVVPLYILFSNLKLFNNLVAL